MGKKAKEFKSGDFIFAKVKGYPAWPARVQSYNGKKYFVYFYGTGETANLPPNMVFDYEENKAKFLTKAVKRRDFNEGVKQMELDFANKTPLEEIIGPLAEAPANDTADDSAINETMDTTAPDTTANDTVADTTGTTQNDTAIEDSDDQGALVIDEGKQKGRKSAPKTPAKPPAKAAKTPRGKANKKDEEPKPSAHETPDEDVDADEVKKDEEIVSRSGRKIRPKRYVDEQTEDNATLPSPLPKKRRAASTEGTKDKAEAAPKADKTSKADFNNVSLSELEDLKEPFKSADPEKENILMAYLPTGTYVGIKLFQSRPTTFKSDTAKLQWEKQAVSNAITLKMQLEREQISPKSIEAQLVMELNLTDEEKASLDKERDHEEKKSRVNFLKSEMKLIELDAKIKSCLCLEKADTELCLKLLDELSEINVRPLMMLKHPGCLETIKRMRAYVGNTPSWDLSENEALNFSKQAHRIRKRADLIYADVKALFSPPQGLSFWEFFSERVLQFKRATASLSADELLELVREPLEMTVPTSHTMKSAIDAANIEEPMDKEEKADSVPSENKESDQEAVKPKEKPTPKKKERAPKKETPKKEKAPPKEKATKAKKESLKEAEKEKEVNEDVDKEIEKNDKEQNETVEKEVEQNTEETQKGDTEKEDMKKETGSKKKGSAAKAKKASATSRPVLKRQSSRKQANEAPEQEPGSHDNDKNGDVEMVEPSKEATEPSAEAAVPTETEEPKNSEESPPVTNGDGDGNKEDAEAAAKDSDKAEEEDDKQGDKNKKEKDDEPRVKRSRAENKKTEAPPRSPARSRKAKV